MMDARVGLKSKKFFNLELSNVMALSNLLRFV